MNNTTDLLDEKTASEELTRQLNIKQTMNTDTPRTDSVKALADYMKFWVDAYNSVITHACTLERELTQANQKIQELEAELELKNKYVLNHNLFCKAYGCGPSDFAAAKLLQIQELEKDKERLDLIVALLGDTRQASECELILYQDDATHDFFVKVETAGRQIDSFFGRSLRTAIDSAIEQEKGTA